jgi:sugar lactone lactonase YvrE
MSDFITGLRGDLVDAADRHRRSGRRRTLPRVWRPVLATAGAVAAALAVLVAARTLSPPPTVRPAIATTVQLGGQPEDAVAAEGSLWVADFTGRVLRVDPASGRVTGRIAVPGHPQAIAAGPSGVWVASPGLGEKAQSVVTRIDPHSARVVDRLPVSGHVDAIAVGAGGVWVIDKDRGTLDRIGDGAARLPFRRAGTLVASAERLWALGHDGTVITVDGDSPAVGRPAPSVAVGHGPAENTIVPDAAGVWIAARGSDEVVRIEGRRIAARFAVPRALGPIAAGDTGVWVVSGDPELRAGTYRLSHVDPETSEVASLDLGRGQPNALVASGDDVWAIAADGTAQRIDPGT